MKHLKHLLAVLLATILLATATACGEQAPPEHTHTFGAWTVLHAPTCTTAGVQTQSCACGEIQTQTIPAIGHTEVIHPAVAPTCSAGGLTEGKYCSTCGEILTAQTVLAALPHTEVIDPALDATCTVSGHSQGKHCSVCGEVIQTQATIDATDHTAVTDPAVAPTCTTTGLTEGSHCADCGTVLTAQVTVPKIAHTLKGDHCIYCDFIVLDFTNPDLYASHYGYDALGKLPNGTALQAFYRRLDEVAKNFHTDTTFDATEHSPLGADHIQLPKVCYKDLNLSYEEATMALSFLRYDRPLYYWMSNNWTYEANGGHLMMQVQNAYASGKARAACHEQLYRAIEDYVALTEGLHSPYLIALTYHDAIIAAIDYAYQADGITPQDELWAHNIHGVLLGQGAVCEGYTKTMQLLLTVSGVENIFVSGNAGGPHAWNLIRLDDGNWYWCDTTWDDIGDYFDGVRHQYFCVNDTQDVEWMDARVGWGTPKTGALGFADEHIPDTSATPTPWERLYDLPVRSATVFDSAEILELAETFTHDGMTFARVGADRVWLVAAEASTALHIPGEVTHENVIYTVTGMSALDERGLFHVESASVANEQVTEITLPDTVNSISVRAFSGCTGLTSVTVPKSVTEIGALAFAYCAKLERITYEGTVAEWQAITLGSYWDGGTGNYTVHCTDGTLTK